jgi:hypothetical protein
MEEEEIDMSGKRIQGLAVAIVAASPVRIDLLAAC